MWHRLSVIIFFAGSVRIGKLEVVTYSVNSSEGLGLKKCRQYSLTRMRSWKVGYTHGVPCLKFHYQDGKESFVWVTITGEKAVFLALCLHSAVNELLRVRGKKPLRTPQDQVYREKFLIVMTGLGAYNVPDTHSIIRRTMHVYESTCMIPSPFEILKFIIRLLCS